jgi:hypothetical protein
MTDSTGLVLNIDFLIGPTKVFDRMRIVFFSKRSRVNNIIRVEDDFGATSGPMILV